MAFMKLQIYRKGALYYTDCERCGCTNYTHEWVHDDHNERRDAMENGTLLCDECAQPVGNDNGQFGKSKRPMYPGRYSAPGYMDCTDWSFDSNKRRLEQDLRSMYSGRD